jgi:GntR family transcriptional regulator, carbon starvation induced regulator
MILTLSASPLDKAAGDTLSERAAAFVEADIVSGALAPGARLGIAELAARYGIGATPMREGLSRLVARGLIVAIGQRGFHVSAVSRADLEDITRLRVLIECEALRQSMERGDHAWEGTIVAALYRLRRYAEDNASGLREGGAEFDMLHKGFHTALIARCGSPRMLAAHSDLYDQAYRYRRIMMGSFEDSDEFVADHRDLADLVIAGKIPEAQEKLTGHLTTTLALVYPAAGPQERGEEL